MPNTTMTQDTDTGRQSVPCAPEIEKAVLGLAFGNPAEVISKLHAAGGGVDSFYIPAHRIIWEHFCRLHDEGRPFDVKLLYQSLEDSGDLESVGGMTGLADIASEGTKQWVLDEYINLLIDKQKSRRLCMDILALNTMRKEGASLEEMAARLQSASEDAAGDMGESGRVYTLKETMRDGVSKLDALIKSGSHIEGVRTGFTSLDSLLGGMRAGGGYYLIAARPGEGKTAIALNIAMSVAEQIKDAGGRVLFVSAEMSRETLGRRLLCAAVGLSWRHMCESGFTKETKDLIISAIKWLNSLPIEILQPRGSVEECAAVVRREARRGNLQLVIVDYAQLFRSEKAKDGNRVDDLEHVSGTFRAMANALPCPLLLLAQVNRAADKSSDKRPGMADVKGCGAFEQDAEAVILLHRPEAHEADEAKRAALRGKAELIVCKNRNGETGTIPLEWNGATQSFSNAPAPEA